MSRQLISVILNSAVEGCIGENFISTINELCANAPRVNVIATQHLHHLDQAIFRMWRDQQMNMVGHQHISMNPAIMLVAGQLKFFKVELIIRIYAENFATVIATNNHML